MGVIIRQSFRGTVFTYAGIVIGFITTFFVLTHYLTPEEVGLTRVFVDAVVLFSGLAQLGTSSSMIRFFPYFQDQKSKNHGIFFWSIVLPFVGFLIFSAVFYFLREDICGYFAQKSPLFVKYYYFVFPAAFFMLYQSVFATNANVLMRIVVPRFVNEVLVRLGLLAGYLLYAHDFISLDGVIIIICATYAVAALTNLIFLLLMRRISFKPDFKFITKPLLRNFLAYTSVMVISALASTFTPLFNTFFVSAKMGLAFTGIFAIASYMSAMIAVPYRSLGAIVLPQLSQSIKENAIAESNQLTQNVSLHQFLIGSAIFFAIWCNIDLVYRILPNGDFYSAGKWVFFILGLSQVMNSTLSVGTSVIGYSRYYVVSFLFTIFLAATLIFLSNFLIPRYGMHGAALATLISNALYFLLLLPFIRLKVKTSPFSWRQLTFLLILLALFGIDLLFQMLNRTILGDYLTNSLLVAIAEGVVRTLADALIGGFVVYRLKISKEINGLLLKIVHRK